MVLYGIKVLNYLKVYDPIMIISIMGSFGYYLGETIFFILIKNKIKIKNKKIN
jgi:hypothetical protein